MLLIDAKPLQMCVWYVYWDMKALDKIKQTFIIWYLQYFNIYVYFGGHFEFIFS